MKLSFFGYLILAVLSLTQLSFGNQMQAIWTMLLLIATILSCMCYVLIEKKY